MTAIYRTKFGFFKQLLIAAVFLLGCIIPVKADPITFSLTTFFVSLAVSAATTAATYLLTALFTPKPKAVDKGKLQGDIQLSNIGEDLPILEIAGGALADGFGGIKVGCIYFLASDIRKTVVEVPGGGGGGGGGGKGGRPSAPAQREYHYYIDLACMVGRGPLNILEIKAGDDIIYQNLPIVETGLTFEIENAALSGGAVIVSDAACSNGKKVTGIGVNGAQAAFENRDFGGDGQNVQTVYVFYKSSEDRNLRVTNNGVVSDFVLANSYGEVESFVFTAVFNTSATNSITFSGDSQTADLDRILITAPYVFAEEDEEPTNPNQPRKFSKVASGVRSPDYAPPPAQNNYDNLFLAASGSSANAGDEYNYQPKANSRGEISANLVNNVNLRIYEGNKTQLPDPLMQFYFEAAYGAGATPAFRNRCYFVLENFEITKYGAVPNITVTAENKANKTIEKLYLERAKRAGLKDEELDFSAFAGIPIRGYGITARQAPRTEMEILNRVFDLDVIEDIDGVIRGVVPSEEVVATITLDELEAAQDKSSSEGAVPNPVQSVIRDDYQIPRFFDVSFFNPQKSFETANVNASREVTVSEKKENIETGIVMLESEAQAFANRELQKLWAEKDALSISTFHKYAYLAPTDLIEVQEYDQTFTRMRLKSVEGGVPGALKFTGVTRNLRETAPRIYDFQPAQSASAFVNKNPQFSVLNLPGHAVGTIIDVANLRSDKNTIGFYAACCNEDQSYKWQGASLLWERASGYQLLSGFPVQATMGRTVDGANGVLKPPGATGSNGENFQNQTSFDAANALTFDLFYGEVETKTQSQLDDRENALLVGNEIIFFKTATRVKGFPNRWTVKDLMRGQKGTTSVNHASNERVVLLTDAVKWVPLDESEIGKTRNYKFVASRQFVESARFFNYTFSGETSKSEKNFYHEVRSTDAQTVFILPFAPKSILNVFVEGKVVSRSSYSILASNPKAVQFTEEQRINDLIQFDFTYLG